MAIGKVIQDTHEQIIEQKAMEDELENQFQSIQFEAEGRPPNFQDTVLDETSYMYRHLIRLDQELPQWWSKSRDVFLRNYSRESGLLASTVYGESTRVKNLSWVLETEEKDNEENSDLDYFKNVLELAQFGQGFPTFLHRVTSQLLTQDNGAFIEIIPENPVNINQPAREAQYGVVQGGGQIELSPNLPAGELAMPLEGRVGGIACFDSRQCWRTFDPEWPVIYVNKWSGRWRLLHWTRVVAKSSHSQPDELARSIGLCAISRTFVYARIIQYMDQYFKEKIAGESADFGTVAGMTERQLRSALNSGTIEADSKGLVVYKNVRFFAGATPDVLPDIKLHSLKGLPDGFDHEKEMRLAATALSVGFGVSTNGLGLNFNVGRTKAEADAQERETAGKGREDIENMIKNVMNQRVLPDGVEFDFDEKDDRRDKEREEIKGIRINNRANQVRSGEASVEEIRLMAAQELDINPEFIDAPVIGDDESITDQKPTDEETMEFTDAGGADVENESEGGETEDTKKSVKRRMAIRESAFYQTLID